MGGADPSTLQEGMGRKESLEPAWAWMVLPSKVNLSHRAGFSKDQASQARLPGPEQP